MATQIFKLKNLKAAPYNPRVKQVAGMPVYEQIKASIEKFGYVDLMVVNRRNNVIIGGHQRAPVLADLGYTEVECAVVDLDEPMEKALNIALNKIDGKWDEALLSALVYELGALPAFDYNTIGFTLSEVDDLALFLPPLETGDDADNQLYPNGSEDGAAIAMGPDGTPARGVTQDGQQAPIEYSRPEFKDICDTFAQNKTSEKNTNWFYVEYYENNELFEELAVLLKSHLKGQSGHEIHGDTFALMVKQFAANPASPITEHTEG